MNQLRRILPWIVAAEVMVALYFVKWPLGTFPLYEKVECQNQNQAGEKYCTSLDLALFGWGHVFEFLEDYDKAIVALATIAIGAFTFTLWRSTSKLSAFTQKMVEHIPLVERAWIFSGPDPRTARLSGNDAFEFQVGIHNYGKTPGVVNEIWWDVIAKEPLSAKVKYVGGTLHKLDIALAGGDSGLIHQHVFSAKPFEYFIGYILYRDIFKEWHMSRFCLRVAPSRFETAGHPAWNDYD